MSGLPRRTHAQHHHQRPSAAGAGQRGRLGRRRRAEQGPPGVERDALPSLLPRRMAEPVLPGGAESAGKHVPKEAPGELNPWHGVDAAQIAMRLLFPTERHDAGTHASHAAVANHRAADVRAAIADGVLPRTERQQRVSACTLRVRPDRCCRDGPWNPNGVGSYAGNEQPRWG